MACSTGRAIYGTASSPTESVTWCSQSTSCARAAGIFGNAGLAAARRPARICNRSLSVCPATSLASVIGGRGADVRGSVFGGENTPSPQPLSPAYREEGVSAAKLYFEEKGIR